MSMWEIERQATEIASLRAALKSAPRPDANGGPVSSKWQLDYIDWFFVKRWRALIPPRSEHQQRSTR